MRISAADATVSTASGVIRTRALMNPVLRCAVYPRRLRGLGVLGLALGAALPRSTSSDAPSNT
jgi:hypothetical protein